MAISIILALPDGVTTTPTALICEGELSIGDWKKIGCTLAQAECTLQWLIGDWWVLGEHAYGHRAKAAARKMFGRYAFGTLMNYGSVARSVETSRRREVLSFSHRAEVAACAPEEQDRWLDVAVRDKLSVVQLRRAMLVDFVSRLQPSEGAQKYKTQLRRLMRGAKNFERLYIIFPPWEDTGLLAFIEERLERTDLSLPSDFDGFAKALDNAAEFWVKTAQAVRRIEFEVRARAATASARPTIPVEITRPSIAVAA